MMRIQAMTKRNLGIIGDKRDKMRILKFKRNKNQLHGQMEERQKLNIQLKNINKIQIEKEVDQEEILETIGIEEIHPKIIRGDIIAEIEDQEKENTITERLIVKKEGQGINMIVEEAKKEEPEQMIKDHLQIHQSQALVLAHPHHLKALNYGTDVLNNS